MSPAPQRVAARQAGLLFGAAGILTILNNFVPGSAYLNEAFLHVVGVLCVALGALVAWLPWERWPVRSSLAIPPIAFAFIGVANERGGVSTYSYAPFFVVVFMWIGLHHPPRTSLMFGPLAALAYMVPGLVAENPPDGALSSVTVAIPVAVLVGETIARVVGRIRQAERRYQHSNEALHRSQALAHVGSWEIDLKTGAVEWSPEMYRLLGMDPATRDPNLEDTLDLVAPEDRDLVAARFQDVIAGEVVPGFPVRIVRPGGEARWLWVEGGPVAGADRVITGFAQDITERKRVEGELERLALRDDLTGLANRRAFITVGEQILRIAHRSGGPVVLVYIDLDNMKSVNDRFGHSIGDRALAETAALLQATFRESDLVARLGGDEFCVLLAQDAEEAQSSLRRLQAVLDMRAGAFPPISLSVGVAQCSGPEPCTIEELIDRADAAMYDQKANRRRADV